MIIEQVGKIVVIKADTGKHFVRKSDNEFMGVELWLGKGDTKDNYVEVADNKDE